MKVWIRILISVCVVLVVGFAIWAFCFREKDEVQAYNRTSELIDYKQSLGIRDKLVNLSHTPYMKNNPENIIGNQTDVEKRIHSYREQCFSDEIINTTGDISFYSYIVMEDYVDELIEYYLPYTQGNTSKNKPLKNLKSNIDLYTKSLKEFNSTLDKLIEYQDAIDGSDTDLEILLGYYENMQSKYRRSLNRSTDVLLSLVAYIDECLYSDNIKLDVIFSLNDAFVRALKVSVNIESILEPDYAQDVKIIMDTIDKYKSGQESIFSDKFKENDFIDSYNKLYNKYSDILNYVYSCKNLEKQQMAEGVSLSNVKVEAQSSLINVLNVLGF